MLDELNRPAPVHLILRVLDDRAAFVERLNVHHHQLHLVAGGELPQLRHLRRVIDPRVQRRVAVERLEMLLRQRNRVQHALANGHARHDDDELLPTVTRVEFKQRPQINVGLARARLHLHGEVQARQFLVRLNFVLRLNPSDVAQNRLVAQRQRIAHAHFREQFAAERVALPLQRRPRERLASKHVHHGADGVQLELLMAVEFDFHGKRDRKKGERDRPGRTSWRRADWSCACDTAPPGDASRSERFSAGRRKLRARRPRSPEGFAFMRCGIQSRAISFPAPCSP